MINVNKPVEFLTHGRWIPVKRVFSLNVGNERESHYFMFEDEGLQQLRIYNDHSKKLFRNVEPDLFKIEIEGVNLESIIYGFYHRGFAPDHADEKTRRLIQNLKNQFEIKAK